MSRRAFRTISESERFVEKPREMTGMARAKEQAAGSKPASGRHGRTWANDLRLAMEDIHETVVGWRVWSFIAWNDISQRYRRSLIGPFWLTLSMGIFVAALGVLYSFLLHVEIHTYLPFLTAGFLLWSFISITITDSATALTSVEGYLKQTRLPKLGMVLRMVVRNVIILGHNFIIFILVAIIFRVSLNRYSLLVIPALLVNIWGGGALSVVLSILCTRFRDMQQILTNLMQVAFFVTPVLWDTQHVPDKLLLLAKINPLAAFMSIFRDALLGLPPSAYSWTMSIGASAATTAVALVFFARFRARIIYWL